MSPKLSIVIPVYKVERYIASCLDSICSQGIPAEEYEIIIVDDCSPDGSMQIVNDYKQRHPNIIVRSQQHSGLSAARNLGLNAASGDFIWFVDSDDTIGPNAGQILLSTQILQGDCDVISIDFWRENNVQGKRYVAKKISAPECSGIEFLSANGAIPVWSMLYKRKFLQTHGLHFDTRYTLHHEDYEFNLRALALARSVRCLRKALYCYGDAREGSLINSPISIKGPMGYFVAACNFIEFIEDNAFCVADRKKLYKSSCVGICFALCDAVRLPAEDYTLFLSHLRKMRVCCCRGLFRGTFFNKILGLFLLLNPHMAVQLYARAKGISS